MTRSKKWTFRFGAEFVLNFFSSSILTTPLESCSLTKNVVLINLPVSVYLCFCLSLYVSFYMFLSISVYFFLFLSMSIRFCQFLSVASVFVGFCNFVSVGFVHLVRFYLLLDVFVRFCPILFLINLTKLGLTWLTLPKPFFSVSVRFVCFTHFLSVSVLLFLFLSVQVYFRTCQSLSLCFWVFYLFLSVSVFFLVFFCSFLSVSVSFCLFR